MLRTTNPVERTIVATLSRSLHRPASWYSRDSVALASEGGHAEVVEMAKTTRLGLGPTSTIPDGRIGVLRE
jgi:hypothetical protein